MKLPGPKVDAIFEGGLRRQIAYPEIRVDGFHGVQVAEIAPLHTSARILAPIAITLPQDGRMLLMSKDKPYILNNRLMFLHTSYAPPQGFLKSRHLMYEYEATIYHLGKLAAIYGNISDQVRANYSNHREFSFKSDLTTFATLEFDALISHMRRCVDHVGKLLWSRYGNTSKGAPSNFTKTLSALSPTSAQIGRWSELSEFELDVAKPVKGYRDCLTHYCSLLPNGECLISWQGADPLVSFLIPDNPESKTDRKFKYGLRLDALSCCWNWLSHIANVSERIVADICTH